MKNKKVKKKSVKKEKYRKNSNFGRVKKPPKKSPKGTDQKDQNRTNNPAYGMSFDEAMQRIIRVSKPTKK